MWMPGAPAVQATGRPGQRGYRVGRPAVAAIEGPAALRWATHFCRNGFSRGIPDSIRAITKGVDLRKPDPSLDLEEKPLQNKTLSNLVGVLHDDDLGARAEWSGLNTSQK